MPTSINKNPLFTERSCLTMDEIKAYTSKALGGDTLHAMEVHMASCAMCSDAVEGYMEVPAFDLSSQMGRKGRGSNHWTNGLVRGVVVAAIGLSAGWLFWFLTRPNMVEQHTHINEVVQTEEIVLYDPQEELLQLNEEVEAAIDIPTTDQVGHDELAFILPEPVLDEEPVESTIKDTSNAAEIIKPKELDVSSLIRNGRKLPEPLPVQNRQLMYLNDLKMVHPKEMYSAHSPRPELTGTPAGTMNNPQEPDNVNVEHLSYTEMMSKASAAYVAGKHKDCAKIMNMWLAERPNDVNAQFYVGLCYYNLGLYEKAHRNLEAARGNEIDTFKEEATWYSALSHEQIHGFEQTREQFEMIANIGGFYSQRAFEKLKQ